MNKTKTEMLLGITSICSFSFLQEKHIRRPYLAFDDVLGDALQVKSLKNIQSHLASSMFIACLIGSRLKRCRENILMDFCDITFPTYSLLLKCTNGHEGPSCWHPFNLFILNYSQLCRRRTPSRIEKVSVDRLTL